MSFDCRPAFEPGSGRQLLLAHAVTYGGARDSWTIPAGFPTDLATVPQVAQWLVDDRGAHDRAAILHDYLCEIAHGRVASCRRLDHDLGDDCGLSRWCSRRDADNLFRRVLLEEGVSPPLAALMWSGVRAGGLYAGGVAPGEAAQLATLAVPGLAVLALSLPPLVGRAALVAAEAVARRRPTDYRIPVDSGCPGA